MISDEAVEAAAKALLRIVRPARPNWDEWAEDGRDMYRSQAAAVLEAAAPHMLAQVWAEGHHTGWSDRDDDAQSGWTPSGYTSNTPNPYRSQA